MKCKGGNQCRMALTRYKQGTISLARASEIAGVGQESFKELLQEAGIQYKVEPVGKAVRSEAAQLMRL